MQSCKFFNVFEEEETVLAKVGEHKLVWSFAKKYIPNYFSKEDSIQKVEHYIETWSTNKLIMDLAQKEGEIDLDKFEEKANKLKEDLIIYEYNNLYLRQNLDTVVSREEIKGYFDAHKKNFLLKNKIIKGYFVKMRTTSPLLTKFKRTFKKNDSTKIEELKGMSQSQATNYLFVENTWSDLESILSNLPQSFGKRDLSNLLTKKELVFYTNNDVYFIRILDIRNEQDVTPLEIKEDKIRHIILNERKLSLIQTLKDTIYTNSKKREYK